MAGSDTRITPRSAARRAASAPTSPPVTRLAAGSLPLVGQRYRLLYKLGEGGMGTVYAALDRLTRQHVALKRVAWAVDEPGGEDTPEFGDARLALAREFETLASLRHPHIIGVRNYGFDAVRQPYFTMDLLEQPGTILDAGRGQPLAVQAGLLAQVLQALAYVHRRGIVHRDLKPGNVLVTGEQVKVLDFGLAISAGKGADPEGTLAYMAPEVLLGTPAGPAADLYAVGIMAYQLCAGRLPFALEQLEGTAIIDNILHTPPDLEPLAAHPALAAVVARLLAKTPEARYDDPGQVIADLSAATGLALARETRATRESFLQAAPLIGRAGELARLEEALAQAGAGQGSVWLVGGESGVGKSRLLDEVRTRALVRGVPVLRGQAVSEGSAPYQVWREVARRLALLVDLSDDEAGILKPLIPDAAPLLERDLPEATPLAPQAERLRLFVTLAAAFRLLTQPAVVILEDLHWAGEESLALLAWLARSVLDLPLLVIGSYRDDERPDLPAALSQAAGFQPASPSSAPERALPGLRLLALRRLAETHIAALSEAMLGAAGRQPQVVGLLQRETEGNVFFLVEVVRVLAEEAGQLDRVGQTTLPAQVLAGGVRRVVQRRLGRVPAEGRPLLELAAVGGRALDLAVLDAAQVDAAQAGTTQDLAAQNVAALHLEGWLAACANVAVLEVFDGRWQFAHDRLRDEVLRQLPDDRRPRLHRQIALAIEAVYPDPAEHAAALAHHWAVAGEPQREARYARLAGELAAARYANEEAQRYLERARALTVEPAARSDVALKLSSVLQLTGRLAEAEALQRQALIEAEQAGDRHLHAQCKMMLGNLLVAKGDYAQAQAWLDQAESEFAALDEPAWLGRAAANLGYVYWNQGQYAQALECFERQRRIATAMGARSDLSQALGGMGLVYWQQGNYPEALACYEEDLKIMVELNDRQGQGKTIGNLGIALWYLGDYPRALSCFTRQLHSAQEIGDRRLTSIACGNVAEVYRHLGDYARALTCYQRQLQIAVAVGNRRGIALAVGNLALTYALLSRPDEAERLARLAVALGRALQIPYYLCEALHTQAGLCAQQGRLAEAQALAVEAAGLARQIGRKEVQLKAQLLALELAARQGQRDVADVLAEMAELARDWPEDAHQAEIAYARWRVDGAQDGDRRKAAHLFAALHAHMPDVAYRTAYAALAGDALEEPAALPELPEGLRAARPAVELDALFGQVDALIAELAAVPQRTGT